MLIDLYFIIIVCTQTQHTIHNTTGEGRGEGREGSGGEGRGGEGRVEAKRAAGTQNEQGREGGREGGELGKYVGQTVSNCFFRRTVGRIIGDGE